MSDENNAEPKVTVGSIANAALREGKTNEEALAAVQEALPEAKTSLASINWYRNKLRSEGEDVPTARELRAKAKAAEAEGGDDNEEAGDDDFE